MRLCAALREMPSSLAAPACVWPSRPATSRCRSRTPAWTAGSKIRWGSRRPGEVVLDLPHDLPLRITDRQQNLWSGLPVLGDDQYGVPRFNRKNGADQIALCLKSLEFQTGTRHEYEYMNGKRFESEQICFPKCVYDEGLMD